MAANKEYDPAHRPDVGLLAMWTLKLLLETAADAKFAELAAAHFAAIANGMGAGKDAGDASGGGGDGGCGNGAACGGSTSRAAPGTAMGMTDGSDLPTAADVINQHLSAAGFSAPVRARKPVDPDAPAAPWGDFAMVSPGGSQGSMYALHAAAS